MVETEYLIIGAGIVGLTIAKRARGKRGADKIIILEKESDVGFHASGRNSGVLHAGIYYPPHTLKAQLCLKGNLLLQDYCMQNNLPLVKAGKVIVARDESELPILLQLHDRAKENGAKVELLDEQQLVEKEPNAKTFQKALYSHYTAMVDNKAILKALQHDLLRTNRVHILFNSPLKSLKDEFTAHTVQGPIRFKQFINAAGAYADKVAHHFGVGRSIISFHLKGFITSYLPKKRI